jgi:PII-like signaling protein/predicted transcriptional regulator
VSSDAVAGEARRVRVYLDEGQRHGGQPLSAAILRLLRKEGAAGATVFRGVEGFGASGQVHTARLVDLDQRLPMVVEWIDSPEQVERLLPRVEALVRGGLITVEDTEVALSRPLPPRDVASGLRAGDVMPREVSSVAPDASVRDVVELLLGKRYRAIPVVRGGAPVGIITNSDLLERAGLTVRVALLASLDRAELQEALEQLARGGRTAESVMTPNPVAVNAAAPLTEVAELMAHRRLKCLPVVDDRGAMVGMVSRLDVLRTAVRAVESAPAEPREVGLAADAPVSQSMRREAPAVFLDTPLPEVV